VSKIGRFDGSVEAWVEKDGLPAGADHRVEVDVYVPASSLSAVAAAAGAAYTPFLCAIGGTFGANWEGIIAGRWAIHADPVDWLGAHTAADTGVLVTPGAHTLTITLHWTGSDWTVENLVDGVTLDTYSTLPGTLGMFDTDPFMVAVGAFDGTGFATDIYYARAVRVYDATTG
jgi:hypothetical protein